MGSKAPQDNRTSASSTPGRRSQLTDPEYKRRREEAAQKRCAALLQSLGWGSGFSVPFADVENRKLEKELEFKQRRILSLRLELNDNTDHAKALEQHLERVKDDLYQYQNVVNNKQSLVEEERNFLGLAERMLSRISEEAIRTEKVTQGCKERFSVMQKDLDRRLKGILELRDIIDFDSDALKAYQARIREFEEMTGDVNKLNLEDEKKIRELEDSRVELGARRRELRFQLDQEAMNTSKFQEQFDRLSVEFRKVHRQRQDMIAVWAATIQAMSTKDEYMKEIADEYYETKTLFRKLSDRITSKERRLRIETCGIRGTEMQLSELDRRHGEIRRRIDEERGIVESLKDACSLCQTEVENACSVTKEKVQGLVKLEKEIKSSGNKYKRYYRIVVELREKLHQLEAGRHNSDGMMTELERILNEEELASEALKREMEMSRKYFWERNNDKLVTQNEILNMETTISRVQNNLAVMMAKELANLDYVAKRSSVIYRLDLDCSIMENRFSKMSNQSIDPRYFDLQNNLLELQVKHSKISKERAYIASELDHVRNLALKCNNDIGKNRKDGILLESELRQCDMLTHGLEKLMGQTLQEHSDAHVRHSLERVFLKRLTDELKSARQQMFGLAEIRNTIHWAVKERKAEIENHRVLNLSRQKALTEVVSKLRVQVGEVFQRTDKLRGRFELVTKLMASSHDTNPEEQTLAYQVRKAACERETIQLESQRWKMQLAEAEKELEGLMNVHKIMQTTNSSLKESLSPADDNSAELKALQDMSVEEQEILLCRNQAIKYRTILRDRMQEIEKKISVIQQEVSGTLQLDQMKEVLVSKLHNELRRQKEKVNRWSGMCSRILKEIKSLFPQDYFQLVQRDLKLRFTNSKFESAVGMLERFLVNYPYVKPFVNYYVQNDAALIKLHYRLNKLPVPHGSESSRSSVANSYTTLHSSRRESQVTLK